MDRKIAEIFIWILVSSLLTTLAAQMLAPVKTEPVKIQSLIETVQAYGTIKPLPEDNISISADSPMRILEILVKPGDEVGKGQLVVRLQRDHSLDVAVEKARISMQKDSLDYQRAITLYDSGVIPKVKLENSKNDYSLSRADYELQKQQLKYAIQNSELTSPINGVVTSVNGAVGQIADPNQPILKIVNPQKMIAILGIEIEDIGAIHRGQKVNLTIPNLPDSPVFTGTVSKLNHEIDPETQLINIWVTLKNINDYLQPGMFAEAGIIVKDDTSALAVPSSAVLHDQQGPYVFVVQDSTAYKIHVRTGIKTHSLTQIVKGLEKGEQVVYRGNYELQDSMKVRVEEKSSPDNQ
jgi:RND family efflux transporter MFP subunit